MDQLTKIALVEAIKPDIAPFTDQVHTLLLDSVDKIADQWVAQLKLVRDNTVALENQVMACVAKAKADINTLHELGGKIADEAKRGQDVCRQLSEKLEPLA